uniref:Uncharacterized protein n=1 Tax=Romanomermis culicivorax TaxID=13658 RepID=A0A915K366_ROMCU
MIETILQKPEDLDITDPDKLQKLAGVRANAHTERQVSHRILVCKISAQSGQKVRRIFSQKATKLLHSTKIIFSNGLPKGT